MSYFPAIKKPLNVIVSAKLNQVASVVAVKSLIYISFS